MEIENQPEYFSAVNSEEVIVYKQAGFFRRLTAFIIDHVILFLVFIFFLTIFFDYLFTIFFYEDWLFAVFVLASVICFNFYFILFEWLWQGNTPGKWFSNIRVTDKNSLRACLTKILVRNLLRSLYFIPPLFILPDLFCFFLFHKKRIGDLAAGTQVVINKS